ncbi:MAG: ABC transporter ATP-binding protein [Nitrososphaerales archaeon]|nr:ABC transporter ATP-binding protein [Nitrososphaerales archaeon]
MGELLRLTQLTKRFSGLEVLKGVSFEVAEGEVVGLIGPNGAGKTTIFNIISGSLKPNSGRVIFASKDITGLPPYRVSRLGIARTFQIPQPFAEMTVLENVRAALLFSNPRSDGRLPKDAEKLCEMAGLSGRLKQPAGSLTAPEKKRLEVARALACSPRLLLLDEFVAGLTLTEASWASGMIKTLSKDYGVTIVWTEHVMRILMRSVERVLVLQAGEVIASGSPPEVVKNERVLSAYFGGKPA